MFGIGLLLTAPLVSTQSLQAFAKTPGKPLSMPAVAPSYSESASSQDANPGANVRSGHNYPAPPNGPVGHSSMMLKVKTPTLQGSAARQGTAGSAEDKPLLEGNVLRETAPDDAFAPPELHAPNLCKKAKACACRVGCVQSLVEQNASAICP